MPAGPRDDEVVRVLRVVGLWQFLPALGVDRLECDLGVDPVD